jgi:NADH:ubiquinone oxidoreductase subunit 6 (subunit J)
MDDKEYAFNGASMRVGGITDMSGYRNLVANFGADVSQVQMDIEIGYDLPVSTQEIEETVFVTNYLPCTLIGVALIAAGIVGAVLIAKRKKED